MKNIRLLAAVVASFLCGVLSAQTLETAVEMPCTGSEFQSDKNFVRAMGMGESMQQTVAKSKALTNAVKNMAGQISVILSAMDMYETKSEMVGDYEDISETFQSVISSKVDFDAGFSVVCEKYVTTQSSNGRPRYMCYVAVEYGMEELAKPVFDALQGDSRTRIDAEYEQFLKNLEEAVE